MSDSQASNRAARGALQAAVQVVLVLVLIATVQFLAGRHNVRWDLTPAKRFLLSPYARQAAEDFAGQAKLYAFYDSQQVVDRRRMLDLLEQFHSYAPGLQYELVDLDRNPGLSKKYEVNRYSTGVLELEDGRRLKIRSISEESITATLLRLTRTESRRVCFVIGHGEASPGDSDQREGLSKLAQAIEREGLTVATIQSLSTPPPPSCTTVVLAAPRHELRDGEAEQFERYIRGGGRGLLLLDPQSPRSFDALLERVGISSGNNIIVDEQNRMLGADSFVPQVDRFRQELFRDRLGASVILPVARTMRALTPPLEGVRVVSLAGTSESTWVRVDTAEVPSQDVEFRPQVDEIGPVSVAVQAIVARGPDQPPGRVIAVGDSDFVNNRHIETLGNRDFILAIVGILAEDPTLIGMRSEPEADPGRPLTLTARQMRSIFWLAVVALPSLATIAGVLLAGARRRQRGGR